MLESPTTTKVWDPFVRLFHWSLVTCVVGNWLNEAGDPPHRYLGYVAAGLVISRIVWGFIGTRHARFSDWVPSPASLRNYLQQLRQGKHWQAPGHNPAAALMMLTLMLVVLALGVSGWLSTTDQFFGEEWLEDLHQGLATTLQIMVLLHMLAAIIESWKQKQNLIWPMVTGNKRLATKDGDADSAG